MKPIPANAKVFAWELSYTPGGIRGRSVTLKDLLQEAYGVFENNRLLQIPAWGESQRYDIEAKVSPEDDTAYQHLDLAGHRELLKQLLAERFHLSAHVEPRELPVYVLEVSAHGARLKTSTSTFTDSIKGIDCLIPAARPGEYEFEHCSLRDLAQILSGQAGRPVVDKTKMAGLYDFRLKWTPERALPARNQTEAVGDNDAPSIFTAVTEQLGMKLRPAKEPIDVVVVDHAEEATGNY